MSTPLSLSSIKRIYFLGIGGIGMSALARFFLDNGCEVKGYDKTSTKLTRTLESEGASIQYKEDVSHIDKNTDCVIWTPAIPSDSILLTFVRQSNMPLYKRAEVLGIISRDFKSYAIAGTHGKTSTTSMLTHFLWCGQQRVSAFLGGIASNFNSNYIKGETKAVVLEADEYDRSFLHLRPNFAALTSMDADHLDIYGTPEEMKASYLQFCAQVEKGGAVFIHHSLLSYFDKFEGPELISYGIDAGEVQARNVRAEGPHMRFDLFWKDDEVWRDMLLSFPGIHNVENALAALCIARAEGLSLDDARDGLSTFKGIKRRFEIIGQNENLCYIDDYAHHPTELKAAIQAARHIFPNKKILGIFQPHLFSRTKDFHLEFASALDLLDECIVLDIYPAREKPIEGVDNLMIINAMTIDRKHPCSKSELMNLLGKLEFDVLMTLGAGDIDIFIENIYAKYFGELN